LLYIAANGQGLAKVGKYILSLAWPLKTRLAEAKLLNPDKNSYSRWAMFVGSTFVKPMLVAVSLV